LVLSHQGGPQSLDFRLVEIARIHARNRLTFHQFMQQLDQREHQLRQSVADPIGIDVEAAGGLRIGRRVRCHRAVKPP